MNSFQESIGDGPKPVLSGSDAHNIEKYGQFPDDKKTWLKAEPSFKGLKQVTIEPQSRCYIGEKPEKLDIIKAKSTKFISKIKIEKKSESDLDEIWFNNEIFFNPELVAIIGNKGSGKSALTDILGLLGNSKQYDSFSFLNKKKFKEKGDRCKAKDFIATLYWKNEDSDQVCLSDEFSEGKIEKVKYIPQSYLENLCNEISLKENLFDKELKSVIFSHISFEERLGKESLDELLSFKTEEINKEISNFREDLKIITRKILKYREKTTDDYKKSLKNQISTKQKELEALKKIEPETVSKPVDDNVSEDMKNDIKKLEELEEAKENIIQEISFLSNEIDNLINKKAVVDKAIYQIQILKESVEKKVKEIENLLRSVEYHNIELFSFQFNINKLESESKKLNDKTEHKKRLIIADDETCLIKQKLKIEEDIKKLSEKIDEPNKKYQNYLLEIEKWKQKISSVQGNEKTPNTLRYFNSKLSEINNIPERIKEFEKQRDELVKNIYRKIEKLVTIHKNYYAPVQKVLDAENSGKEVFNISFNVSIINNNFKSKFFKIIDRNKIGTFYGDGYKVVNQMLNKYDFNNSEDMLKFVHEVFYCLDHDCRIDKKNQKNPFELQIKKDFSPEELYNLIFSLEYIEPEYSLQFNKKSLEKLSPGERGILLLFFYLMVDKDDRPLILDQPEENLDNQTIYKVLVTCIKKTKEKRQIFLVTHNPNLAVVCDAEQIIEASIDKKNKNTVSYQSGAIENLKINKTVVDILEGTKPAFENRESKYHDV